ncbi:MAG: class I SAM-dependent methyltransferase [Eubacterium sp.]|nr:class I SAM-dependent methyltransferase [Eubacterium sp.]
MNKKDVIEFFDNCAPNWDSNMVRNEAVISKILDNAKVEEGKDVLDVACGTGVLFPDYIKRNVGSLTGIDISPKMAEIAESKFLDENVCVVCGDVEVFSFDKKFDAVVVYNAFPHFPNPERLIAKLGTLVKQGGTVTVAHGMSRKMLEKHHAGAAKNVSIGLISEDALADIFEKYLKVTTKISDDEMYQVVGIKE